MPIRDERILPGSGMAVALTMPDLYSALLTAGTLPNPLLASILKLIEASGEDVAKLGEAQRLRASMDHIRGLYGIAQLCLESPKLRLDLKPGELPGEGEIGPADLTLNDLEHIYWRFFRGDFASRHPTALAAAVARRVAAPAPAGASEPGAAQ